jgi:type II secretory pathway pseudopilin PulG
MPIANCQLPNEMRPPAPVLCLSIGNRQLAIGIRPRAFTLVELMLSLAMVLVLIIGINFVFRSATDAVTAGQALNGINSDAQATQPLLFDDLRNVSKNPPCFIISSQLVTQFLNTDDARTGSDPTVIAIDNAGTQVKISNSPAPGFASTLSPAILNNRNHRADLLKFFAHALYHRRSGPDGTYIATDSSDDAFIEIGHAALPANDLSNFYGPSNSPNAISGVYNGATVPGIPRLGAYAADWVLARRITLLKYPSSITNGPPASNDYYYPIYGTVPTAFSGNYGPNMSPLSYGTPDNNGAGVTQFQSSRYDLAGVTPEQFDRLITNCILTWQNSGAYSGNMLWWNPLIYAFGISQANPTPPQYYSLPNPAAAPATPPYIITYNNTPPGYTPSPPGIDTGLWYNRPQCNPMIQTPVSAASIAGMASFFLQHCSQFIVEYAGDYLQQDINGNMTGLGPDGQIDYYVDANGNKHIRWYGMPRSSTGVLHNDGFGNPVLIRGFDGSAATPDTLGKMTSASSPAPMTYMLNYFTDVIPLRDYYSLWFNTNPPPAGASPAGSYAPPWEVDVNFDATHDYGSNFSTPANGPNGNAFNNPKNPPRYVAAWHDDMPAMVRILIKVDDPNNKVKDGPWYEFVFRLK